MKPMAHEILTGWKELPKLAAIIGNEEGARRLLFVWTNMASPIAGDCDDFFTGPGPETDAERLKKMRSAAAHISALTPLLDQRMAWLVAVAMPGLSDGPEVADSTEVRLANVVASLESLLTDINRAAAQIKPKKGRQLRLTPSVVLLVSLIGNLKDLGVKFSVAENSKMVRAVRLCWEAAGLEGDPRDQMRTLHARQKGGVNDRIGQH